MRSSSSCSWAPSSRTRLLASTTAMGSTKIVSPDPELSCTMPGTAERDDAFTASTGRPPRSVVNVSCRCDRSRTASSAQQVGRLPAGGGEAPADGGQLRRGRVEQPAARDRGRGPAPPPPGARAPRSGAATTAASRRRRLLAGRSRPRAPRARPARWRAPRTGPRRRAPRRGPPAATGSRTSKAPPGPPTPRSRRRSASSVSAPAAGHLGRLRRRRQGEGRGRALRRRRSGPPAAPAPRTARAARRSGDPFPGETTAAGAPRPWRARAPPAGACSTTPAPAPG